MDELLRGGSAVLVYVVALYGGRNPRGPAAVDGAIERVRAMLRQWRRREQARRELAGLDDYLLHDIGLSRSQARFESGKPFWRA